MERWRLLERGQPLAHYFSIPGGGIEPGETPEQTAVREIAEETSVKTEITHQILEMREKGYSHKIYLCRYISGEPHLSPDSSEAQEMTNNNRFKPTWVSIDTLPELPFLYWQPLKEPLIKGLAAGFEPAIKVVNL